jgi:hypothetical protein
VRAGALPETVQPAAAMRALSAGLIGVAVLRLSDRLGPGEDADKIAANALDITLAGLKSGVVLQPISESNCPLAEEQDSVATERAS